MDETPISSDDEGRARRSGRGRLSSIDMLPEDADEAIEWANVELRERKMPQNVILREFNAMLADRGIKGVSKSSFGRYAVRAAIELRKMDASRRITDAILARMPVGERSDSMIAATELLKFRIIETVMDEDADPKALAQASLSLQRISSTAARTAEIQRRDRKDQQEEVERAERMAQEQAARETADAVERIATEVGLSAERVRDLRRGVLGLSV